MADRSWRGQWVSRTWWSLQRDKCGDIQLGKVVRSRRCRRNGLLAKTKVTGLARFIARSMLRFGHWICSQIGAGSCLFRFGQVRLCWLLGGLIVMHLVQQPSYVSERQYVLISWPNGQWHMHWNKYYIIVSRPSQICLLRYKEIEHM